MAYIKKLQLTTLLLLTGFSLLNITGCLTSQQKTISLDSNNLEYNNPLLESEEIKKKTENDIPSPNSDKESIAQVEIPESPFSEYPKDLPTPSEPKPNVNNNRKTQVTPQQSTIKNNTTAPTPATNAKPSTTKATSTRTEPSASSPTITTLETRDVIAEVRGDGKSPLEIDLPGKGWAYRQKRSEKRTINYIGKENTAKGTLFQFSLPREGSYLLTFVQQDNITGRAKAYDVRVIIGSGNFDTTTSPYTLKEDSNISPAAAIEKAIAEKNYPELNRLLNLHINNPAIPIKLITAAYKALKQSGNYEKMRLLLLYKLEKIGKDDVLGMAFYYYEMATTYEQPGRFRDIKRAYNLYKKVYDNYPISIYSGKSKKRMDYIERHFLKVY